jgi:hypothetical protein
MRQIKICAKRGRGIQFTKKGSNYSFIEYLVVPESG